MRAFFEYVFSLIWNGFWKGFGRFWAGLGVARGYENWFKWRFKQKYDFSAVLDGFWGSFGRGYGRASGGFWKGLAEFLEGLGASWTLGALWVAGERAKRALRDMRFPFLGCILLHFVVLACFSLHFYVFSSCFFIFGRIWLLLRILAAFCRLSQ